MLINIKYNRPEPKDGEEIMSDSELTLNYIEFATTNANPNGLSGSERRIFGRIQRKMDEAILDKKDNVEMEKAEMDLLKQSFEKATFPGNLSKFVVMLEDEINKPKEKKT